MREIWKALVTRLVYLLTPKPPALEVPSPPLTHGFCHCSHPRNAHLEGNGRCGAAFKPHAEVNETDDWLGCACQVYIQKRDNDDPPDPQPDTPSPAELERLYSK